MLLLGNFANKDKAVSKNFFFFPIALKEKESEKKIKIK